MAVVAVTALAAACGDKQDAPTHPDAPAVAPSADDARVQRAAEETRKRFMGDGKSQYTPQRVDGF
ncbi:hypothetical protein GG851_12075 [Bordetella petrii]|uniref:Lipoprotein n=2 Tax=Bordetella petrii TaxID=94624 RepID=A9IF62_BORPD|nr:hypothetical protein [Bordetella petrii]CAP44973.1 putative lipoprotein [Bordetella petrii]